MPDSGQYPIQIMHPPQIRTRRPASPPSCEGMFQAMINRRPLVVSSLLSRLTLRPELARASDHWIWKVIAEGKVGRKRTSIGLFLDFDLEPGTYALVGQERVRIVYNETQRWRSVVYHSAHFQCSAFTLLEANRETRRLRGQFSFSISAMGFAVTDGLFDVQCQ